MTGSETATGAGRAVQCQRCRTVHYGPFAVCLGCSSLLPGSRRLTCGACGARNIGPMTACARCGAALDTAAGSPAAGA